MVVVVVVHASLVCEGSAVTLCTYGCMGGAVTVCAYSACTTFGYVGGTVLLCAYGATLEYMGGMVVR